MMQVRVVGSIDRTSVSQREVSTTTRAAFRRIRHSRVLASLLQLRRNSARRPSWRCTMYGTWKTSASAQCIDLPQTLP